MRFLKRNQKHVVFKTWVKDVPITLDDGSLTGEYETVYDERKVKCTIVPATGDLLERIFGIINDSSYVIYTHDVLNIGDRLEVDSFGETINCKISYRKEFLDHNVYGITTV